METTEPKMQIAVLIDSENVSSRYASIIFNEIETYAKMSAPAMLPSFLMK